MIVRRVVICLLLGVVGLFVGAIPIFYLSSSDTGESSGLVNTPPNLPKLESALSFEVQDFFSSANSTYALNFWLDTKSLRGIGYGRNIVAIKYKQDNPTRRGFAFAFNRTKSAIFPEVYWGDNSENHGWFTFSEYAPTGKWAVFSIIYSKGQLELWLLEKSALVSLGGFSLKDWGVPESEAPFKLGNDMVRRLKGRVGAISLLKFAEGIEVETLQKFLKDRFLDKKESDLEFEEVFKLR